MRGFRVLAALIGLSAALAVPGTALSARAPYSYYTACGTAKSSPPDATCSRNSAKAAFFRSNNAHVTYKVCVKFPSGQKLCANNQDAPKGKIKVNTITSNQRGDHKVTWFVGGVKVGVYTLTVT
jgi:hypothetical protein